MNLQSIIIAIIVSAVLGIAGFYGLNAYKNTAKISNLGSEITMLKTITNTYRTSVDTSDFTGISNAQLDTLGITSEIAHGTYDATAHSVVCSKKVNGTDYTVKTLGTLKDDSDTELADATPVICFESVNVAAVITEDTNKENYDVEVVYSSVSNNITSNELAPKIEGAFISKKATNTTATNTNAGDGAIKVVF